MHSHALMPRRCAKVPRFLVENRDIRVEYFLVVQKGRGRCDQPLVIVQDVHDLQLCENCFEQDAVAGQHFPRDLREWVHNFPYILNPFADELVK